MKRIYLIAIALLSMSLLSCQKEDVADYQICFAKDSDFQHSVDKESPKVKEVYGYIMNELIGEYEKQYPDMRMKVSVRMPGSADVEAMHTFDNASEELRRIEKIAKNMVKLSLSEDTDTGNFTIAYKLTLYCFSSDHKHSQNTICEVPFLVEYKGGEWNK